mgnify:CR=1 FL=1
MPRKEDLWDFPTSYSLRQKPLTGERGKKRGNSIPSRTPGEREAPELIKRLEELGIAPWQNQGNENRD